MLQISLEANLITLKPNEVIKLYLELLKLSVPKLARVPYVPKPVQKPQQKVTFEVVEQVPKT